MAMNFVARMTLKNQEFDSGLVSSANKIKEFEKVGKNASGFLNSFGGSLTSTATKFAGWAGAGIAAKEGLEKFMRSCQSTSDFLDRESNVWKGLFDSFFESLNSGDVSAFLRNMGNVADSIREATRAADDFADAKASMGVFSKQFQVQQQEIINKYRRSSDPKEKQALQTELKKLEAGYSTKIAGVAKQAERVLDATIGKLSARIGNGSYGSKQGGKMTRQDVLNFFNSDVSGNNSYQQEAKRIVDSYNDFRYVNNATTAKLAQQQNAKAEQLARAYKKKYGVSPQVAAMWLELDDKQRDELRGAFNAVSDAQLEGLTFQSRGNRLLSGSATSSGGRSTVSSHKSTSGGGVSTDDPIKTMENQLLGLRKQLDTTADGTARDAIQAKIDELQAAILKLQMVAKGVNPNSLAGLKMQASDLQSQMDYTTDPTKYAELQSELKYNNLAQFYLKNDGGRGKDIDFSEIKGSIGGITKIDLPTELDTSLPDFSEKAEDVDKYSVAMGGLSKVMGSLSTVVGEGASSWIQYGLNVVKSAMSATEAIKALIPVQKTQAITSAAANASSAGPFGWINAIVAITSMIAAIASIPKFATGGIVPGSSFVGDNVMARVNSGEMILNRTQQANLYKQINGGGATSGGQVQFVIKGSQLVGALNNYNNSASRR